MFVKKTEETQVISELKEKIKQLKYLIFDTENQNTMLRRELLIANKVIEKETPEVNLERIEKGKEFIGQEEEAVQLRQKIDVLRIRIQELEDGLAEQPDQLNKTHKSDEANLKLKPLNKKVALEITANRREQFTLYENCCRMKNKIEIWKTRNKELRGDSKRLRLELDKLIQNEEKVREIQNSYHEVERELRDTQLEKLNLRCKLDNLKTRNQQLLDEQASLKEDVKKLESKIRDDDMLLEALTSQQKSFQDFIARQKLITCNNHTVFLKDLKNVENKHNTNLTQCQEMEEEIQANDQILLELQDTAPFSINISVEDEEPQSEPPPEKIPSESTLVSSPTEVQQDRGPLDELEKERDALRTEVEQQFSDVEELKDFVYDNDARFNSWIFQLFQCETKLITKDLEIKKLNTAVKTAEKVIKKPRQAGEFAGQSSEDITIKEAIHTMEYYVLDQLLHNTTSLSTKFINLYIIITEKMTRLFVERICEIRKQCLSEKITDSSANTSEVIESED